MHKTNTDKIRLQNALRSALDRYEDVMGEAFPVEPRLDVLENEPGFIAFARPDGDGVLIEVSSPVANAVEALWNDALSEEIMGGVAVEVGVDKETLIDLSLQWLMLHEIEHWNFGHFRINGGAALAETSASLSYALTRQATTTPSLIDGLDDNQRGLAPLCMELQADHDATEMILGPYDPDKWADLRMRAVAVFAMLVLIDQQDRNKDHANLEEKKRTHPMAATRIFMMLGHLAEMWSIPARQQARARGEDKPRPDELPPEKEVESYHQAVVAPAFADALKLAAAGGAAEVVAGLGNMDDFIADIRLAQTADHAKIDLFRSKGAKEWAMLMPVNDPIMKLLGLESLNTEFIE